MPRISDLERTAPDCWSSTLRRRWSSRSWQHRWSPLPAGSCSAGSACAFPGSIWRCFRSRLPRSSTPACFSGTSSPAVTTARAGSCRRLRRDRGRPARLPQGHDRSELARGPAIGRGAGHGPPGRSAHADRPDRRRRGIPRARDLVLHAHSLLAAGARADHRGDGARVSARHCRLPGAPRAGSRGVVMAVLEARGLSKAFGGIQAVRDVGFVLEAGELLALIGPNGAGKTTCFNCLNGQIRPDAGSVRLGGSELVGLPPRAIWRLGVGRTFQIAQTFGSLNVAENVQQALLSHHRRTLDLWHDARGLYREGALALLARVAMTEQAERPCAVLAYGDLKRVELAVALAHDPRLLLMDEPTAGM